MVLPRLRVRLSSEQLSTKHEEGAFCMWTPQQFLIFVWRRGQVHYLALIFTYVVLVNERLVWSSRHRLLLSLSSTYETSSCGEYYAYLFCLRFIPSRTISLLECWIGFGSYALKLCFCILQTGKDEEVFFRRFDDWSIYKYLQQKEKKKA